MFFLWIFDLIDARDLFFAKLVTKETGGYIEDGPINAKVTFTTSSSNAKKFWLSQHIGNKSMVKIRCGSGGGDVITVKDNSNLVFTTESSSQDENQYFTIVKMKEYKEGSKWVYAFRIKGMYLSYASEVLSLAERNGSYTSQRFEFIHVDGKSDVAPVKLPDNVESEYTGETHSEDSKDDSSSSSSSSDSSSHHTSFYRKEKHHDLMGGHHHASFYGKGKHNDLVGGHHHEPFHQDHSYYLFRHKFGNIHDVNHKYGPGYRYHSGHIHGNLCNGLYDHDMPGHYYGYQPDYQHGYEFGYKQGYEPRHPTFNFNLHDDGDMYGYKGTTLNPYQNSFMGNADSLFSAYRNNDISGLYALSRTNSKINDFMPSSLGIDRVSVF